MQEKDGQYSVVCSIGDMGSDVFRLELAMPDKLTAEMIKNNFIAHGGDIFEAAERPYSPAARMTAPGRWCKQSLFPLCSP